MQGDIFDAPREATIGSRGVLRGVLIATAKRISQYAGGDAALIATAEELQHDVAAHKNAPMPVPEMKERYFRSYNAEMSRAPSGKANKRA
jgi:hypothetical protein